MNIYFRFCVLLGVVFFWWGSVFANEEVTCYMPQSRWMLWEIPEKHAKIDFWKNIQISTQKRTSEEKTWSFIPETDLLIDALITKLYGESKRGTMILSRELQFPFYNSPLYGKVHILGRYNRWIESYPLFLSPIPSSLTNPNNIYGEEVESLCGFQDKNPISYNHSTTVEYTIYIPKTGKYTWKLYPFDPNNLMIERMRFPWGDSKQKIIISDPIVDIADIRISITAQSDSHASYQVAMSTKKYQPHTYRNEIQKETIWAIFPYYTLSTPELLSGTYKVVLQYEDYQPQKEKYGFERWWHELKE